MIKTTLLDFWGFLKKPMDRKEERNFWSKFRIIFIFLGVELLFLFCILVPLEYFIELFLNVREKLSYKYDTLEMSFLSGLIFAPISEEIMFRWWLRRRSMVSVKSWDRIFPYLLYISSIIFGLIHLSNYENDSISFYLLAPIIIGSQMIGGFVLAFIRIRFNLFWSIFYHFLWNLVMFLIMIGEDHLAKSYQDKTPHYSIEILEKNFFDPYQKQVLKIDSLQGKIYKMEVEQYSFQHLLDTLYQKEKYYIDDSFIQLKLNSQKGLTKSELLEILKREYEIEPNERK